MPSIIPIKELRDMTQISERCHDTDEPIFVTKNGYGDMVIVSMETYHKDLVANVLIFCFNSKKEKKT